MRIRTGFGSGCTAAVLLMLLALTLGLGAEPDNVAVKAAEKWLALIDAAKFGESWDQASPTFQHAISKEKWIEAVADVREQVGKFESRKFSTAQAITDPPNAPPGDYMILQYTSNFASKNAATEMIVLSHDPDKQWRTSGYFVK